MTNTAIREPAGVQFLLGLSLMGYNVLALAGFLSENNQTYARFYLRREM